MHGKRILLTALLLTIAIADQSFALFGAGDIVSDPMSYTYYVEQIKMMTEEIEAAQERLESLKGFRLTPCRFELSLHKSTVRLPVPIRNAFLTSSGSCAGKRIILGTVW